MKRNGLGVDMKNLRLVIGIVVILAIVCSPVLAISMSDLIAQHQGQSAPTIPTIVPTTIPTPVIPSSYVMPSSDGDTPLNCDPTIFEGLRHYDPNSAYGFASAYMDVLIKEAGANAANSTLMERIQFHEETSYDGGIPGGVSSLTLFKKLLDDYPPPAPPAYELRWCDPSVDEGHCLMHYESGIVR